VRRGCGEQRRPYTKQRAFQETSTSWPRLTLAFPLCARAWEEAWTKGRAMNLDETVSYVLEEEAAGA
jgi:hypothetical protein